MARCLQLSPFPRSSFRSFSRLLLFFSLLPFPITHSPLPTLAQITPDGTVGTVVTGGPAFTITGGSRPSNGPNLFHSFSQFSVPTGGAAIFNNAADVTNIISRVTGGSVSSINGLIQANGSANLFLINPAGIVFGPNARLNIGGSFIGSTASSLKFSDGTEFSAVNPAPPLLTINVPIGLQMGPNPGAIAVQGNGNDAMFPTANPGMVATPGKTIALVGGDVTVSGGVITAPAGRIEVGAVNQGLVGLVQTPVGWNLDYTQAPDLRDIQLTNRSSLWNPYPASNPLGGIQVVGRDVSLNQSQIAAVANGNNASGPITVNAQRTLSLSGVNANAQAPSAWIVNLVNSGATGNGGAVTIQAGTVSLIDGTAIETLTLGTGNAGNLQVIADTVFVDGSARIASPLHPLGNSDSRIASATYATGSGGNLDVRARQITITHSAQISTLVAPGATGQGGNLTITAREDLTARGISPSSLEPPGLASATYGSGKGGNLQVSTGTLHLLDGGTVFAFTGRIAGIPGTGVGNAGDVTVVARQGIELSGIDPLSPTQTAGILSLTAGAGDGGNVRITAPVLSVQGGATVGTTTLPIVGAFGDITQATNLGEGGNITLNISDRLTISGINPLTQLGSSVSTSTLGNGNAGAIAIQTNQLVLQDGGLIGAATAASGNAGEVTIQAQEIIVAGFNVLPTTILANAPIFSATTRLYYGLPDFPTGNTGNLTINTDSLTVRDGGQISVFHQGTGNAGQVSIQANTLKLDQGQVNATTRSGQGGNINLNVQRLLLLRHGSQIIATAGGSGDGGNITITSPIIAGFENSDMIANALNGRGGKIQITTQGIFGLKYRPKLTPQNDITASSEFGLNGTVAINNVTINPTAGLVELPVVFADASRKVVDLCGNAADSSFVITGRGGLPANPLERLESPLFWEDWRDPSEFENQPPVKAPRRQAETPTVIMEANAIRRNPDGTEELVAIGAESMPMNYAATCAGRLWMGQVNR